MPALITATSPTAAPAKTPFKARPKAPHVVGPATKKATRPTVPIPQFLIDEAKAVEPTTWDAEKHLAEGAKPNITTMTEIGLGGHGISDTAVSEPFPLFTRDAIMQMRREIFSDSVLENCRYKSTFNANMVRGMGWERAPFTHNAWWDEKTLAKIAEIAGIELVPAFDFEIANINISINDQNEAVSGDTGAKTSSHAWHYDSFPFVVVTMCSDCNGMVGGETAISLPNGEERRARGPEMGTAVVMQGRYIYHQALKAYGGRERIAMVTAFRAKSIDVPDETILVGSRAVSNFEEYFSQYIDYRLEVLEDRIRNKAKSERRRQQMKKPFNIPDLKDFLSEQKEYIESAIQQLEDAEADAAAAALEG